MRPILFYIGDFPVRSYGLIVAISILLGIGVATYFARREGKYEAHISGIAFYTILGAIIGARVWQVLFFDWGYYSQHPAEIIALWHGGMSIQGGLVGGFAAGLLYTWRYRVPFWDLADVMAPGIIFGQGIGRAACLMNGDAFGSPTGGNYGLVYPPGTFAYDTYGSQPLFPAEVWEGQWDMVVFALLLFLKQRKLPTGYLFLFYNILYSAGRFLLEFLRGDSPRTLGMTAAQWTSLAVIALALILMVYLKVKPARREEPASDVSET
ncbi:prolipoprotein diacylglyceryl transferase [Effusibacillus dendaii]|uniref:Phosphatidylglycerol--prolipoprotein diacylglyceryl transferase n=1 Tax=Effusibacillus dendaii TaxID=2743772 RepID=A0A7I8D8Y6_9BACL|nr:prolipoprotein diacylglyceryl transferase [Effusibacillus dendaii]BCJ86545.1 prolipoprotein diacylglyceryl transferase [Effusibacillus dendaii]